jgi:hypothetical protein
VSRNKISRWQPPNRLALGKDIVGWTEDIISDGEGCLQSQPFWSDLSKAEKLIRGKECVKADENRSDLTTNPLKLILREMVAAISDVRYPDVWSSDNRAFSPEAKMFSQIAKGVWFESRFPLSIRRMAQWMVMGGTAYLWPVFRRVRLSDPHSTAICLDDYGARDVVPFMMPQNNNTQGCYANTVIRMMPEHEAHARFHLFQDKIRPVSRRRMQSDAVSKRMNFIESLRGNDKTSPWSEQLCEIRYTLVRDLSINETGMPIPIGEPGSSSSYIVPSMGADMAGTEIFTQDQIEDGITKHKKGERKMRSANIDDCRLYPNMRLIITASGVSEGPVFDGPAWSWHGMMPPRFFADDWVSESMGFSLIRDVLDAVRALQRTERACDMKVSAQMDPGMAYDTSKINPATAEALDPWELRKRLGVDGEVDDKTFRTIIPPELMKIGEEPFVWLKYLSEYISKQLGANQFQALAQAKMQSSEPAEDLLRIAGPIARDISAAMESPMADVMEMLKYEILQRFDTARVMTYVGPDGVTPITLDLEPDKLVPSHMPGEDNGNPSQFSRMERAKAFARNLRLQVAPGSIHGLPQTQQKLILMQMWRSGFPMNPERIAEAVGISNWGTLDGSNDLEKWQSYKRIEVEFAAALKREAGALMPSAQPPSGAGPQGGPAGKGGRPPSGTRPPAARTKGSAEGPRAVISESG